MEEVIGIKVVDGSKGTRGFMTWGRLYGATNEDAIVAAVRPHLSAFGLYDVESIAICFSLRDLADQPYFYEALLSFARDSSLRLSERETLLAERRAEIESGRGLYYLG